MGRFDTLNADTRDLVNCLVPALASQFKVADCVDIIPEDIRMRAWDCERRDHIKDQTENDPRNWGVQFLKDLMAIARLKQGDVAAFQTDLRAKVDLHEEKHPWCRLSDIKELKEHYQNPNKPAPVEVESSGTSSTDSYLKELHEPDLPSGRKRKGARNHEIYEARVQESHKRRKYGPKGRLRRSESGGFIRKDKTKGKGNDPYSSERATPRNIKRRNRTVQSDGDDSNDSRNGQFFNPTPSYSMSPAPIHAPSQIAHGVDASEEPLEAQKLQAELEVAEAELKTARLKMMYIQAKEKAEKQAKYGGGGTQAAPHDLQ